MKSPARRDSPYAEIAGSATANKNVYEVGRCQIYLWRLGLKNKDHRASFFFDSL